MEKLTRSRRIKAKRERGKRQVRLVSQNITNTLCQGKKTTKEDVENHEHPSYMSERETETDNEKLK